jgi:outer membrane protein assembly factor BamB
MNTAEIVREVNPIDDERIHGVTFDGKLVWFARDDELVAYDPETSTVVKRLPVPGARAGTAFDGELLYQLARGEILVVSPSDGAIVRRMPAPGKGGDSGMAYADGHLFVGNGPGARIHKVDAKTGEVVRTLSSDRFVTGVSCVGGALWHAVSTDGKTPELRRLGPDGTVEEAVPVPVEHIAGVEGTGDGTFWCAGERGKLRLVRATPGSTSDPRARRTPPRRSR